MFNRLKGQIIALGVRLALFMGYVVIVIGVARSGKTFILERATPGKIIDKKSEVLKSGIKPVLLAEEIPTGAFAIDETQLFDADSLISTLDSLTERSYLIAIQSKNVSLSMGLDRLFSKRRRVEITLTR